VSHPTIPTKQNTLFSSLYRQQIIIMFIQRNRLSNNVTMAVASFVAVAVVVSSVTGVAAASIPIYGTCTSNSDCTATMRSRMPEVMSGVGLCACYAQSSISPFDECEGESDETCAIADCYSNSCDGYVAYCPRSKNGSARICTLRTAAAVDDIEIA
jgi:hypothetical protein